MPDSNAQDEAEGLEFTAWDVGVPQLAEEIGRLLDLEEERLTRQQALLTALRGRLEAPVTSRVSPVYLALMEAPLSVAFPRGTG